MLSGKKIIQRRQKLLEIKKFAQDILGCGCSEDVFKSIDRQENIKIENNLNLDKKILIGNRLLIYILNCDDPEFITHNLGSYINAGIRERNSNGYNRLRFVISASSVNLLKPAAEKSFQELSLPDDKIHLHILDRSQTDHL